jgi:hypothetical protein
VPEARLDDSGARDLAGDGHPAARGPDATYSRVAELPVRIEHCELLPLVRDTTSGFTKVSIVVRLTGNGHEGQGEDITWDQIDQIEQLRRAGDLSWLRGTRTVEEFSTLLGLADLFPVEPIRDSARFYRRWAFERGARPRPTPKRRLAAGRRRASGQARHFRSVDPDR